MVPGEARGRCSSLEAPTPSARQHGLEEDVGPQQTPCGGCRPAVSPCQLPSAATAGESACFMVNPTWDSQSLKWRPSFPPASPTEAWSPKSTPEGGWTHLDDRFSDERTKLSLNLSNLSRSFLLLGNRDQEKNYPSSVSRK